MVQTVSLNCIEVAGHLVFLLIRPHNKYIQSRSTVFEATYLVRSMEVLNQGSISILPTEMFGFSEPFLCSVKLSHGLEWCFLGVLKL